MKRKNSKLSEAIVAKTVTMRAVARHAKVSIATVSHVINKTRHVNQETREVVLNSIDELGYVVTPPGASRKSGNKLLGLIIADIREDFYTEIVKAAELTASEHGYSLILCDSEDHEQKELFYLRMLLEQGVQGIIMAPINHASPPALLKQVDIPIVLIDRCYQGVPYDFIGIDNLAAGRDATLSLLRQGAQNIGFIGYDDSVFTIQKRILGYLDALELAGKGESQQVLRLKYHTDRTTGKIATMVKEFHLDGLVCGTSHACYETVAALRENGIRVPEDVKIITFDENKWFEFLSFPLSVVRQPTAEIGTLAVEFVVNKIRYPLMQKRAPRTVLLNVSIVNR